MHTFNPNTWKTEKGSSLSSAWSEDEFQDRHGYTEKLCLENNQDKTKTTKFAIKSTHMYFKLTLVFHIPLTKARKKRKAGCTKLWNCTKKPESESRYVSFSIPPAFSSFSFYIPLCLFVLIIGTKNILLLP